jgi:D-aspartate ligase
MNTSTPVVLFACGFGSEGVLSGYGGLGVARTLGRLGVPVYLVCDEGLFPTSFSRYWKGTFRWDLSAPAEQSVQFLRDVGRRLGARPVLLHTTDRSAAFVADHGDALEETFTFPKVSSAVVGVLRNKLQMSRAAKEHGIPAPEMILPRSREEVVKFLDTARFPIVLKGVDPLRSHGVTKEIVHHPDDLLEKYDLAAGSPNLMLQEYIPGDDTTVWMCNAYFDHQSDCIAACTGRKIRQYPPHAGVASLSICEVNEAVQKATKDFMKAVGYRGLVGIGYRYDARDGLYKILDVNPRVSGVFRLFVGRNSMDVVRICYLDQTRQPIPPLAPPVGRKWMLEEDFFSVVRYARDGKLTFPAWVASLRGVEEMQWFAPDDLMPFLVWCRMRVPEAARGLWNLAFKQRRPSPSQPITVGPT